MGRPTKYLPEYDEQARRLCLLGATIQELATAFDVADTTIDKWIAEKPSFSGAIKAGREGADADVVQSLYDKAMNGDTTACIFWLKNRRAANWRDRVEHTGKDGGPVIASVTVNLVRPAD